MLRIKRAFYFYGAADSQKATLSFYKVSFSRVKGVLTHVTCAQKYSLSNLYMQIAVCRLGDLRSPRCRRFR